MNEIEEVPRKLSRMPRWPPPGLERVQGDLFGVASRAALAGAFLVLPLLFVVTRDAGFATLGPLADGWWVMLGVGVVGLALSLDAFVRTARLLRRSATAARSGYDLTTVLRVLADAKRDTGFLLMGGRHFSLLDARDREAVARIRVFSAVLLAGAGLWLASAFALGLPLAARGLLTPLELEFVVVVPALVGYLFGGVAYLIEERLARRARSNWHSQPRSEDLAAEEVRSWKAEVSSVADAVVGSESPSETQRRRWLDLGGVVAGALAVAIALPVLTLVPASAVGPILTAVSAPAFDSYRPRAARAEAYRSYAIGGDPGVSPEEAGRILHALTFVASDDEPNPGERMPEPRVAEPWIPGDVADNPFDLDPFAWGDSLLERVAGGLTPEQRTYLSEVTTHPLADDFSRLARATALDAASGRWSANFPRGLTIATMPVPQFGPLRAAANARIGAAALAFAEGRVAEAERLVSEVVAVGFLLADDGPTLIDNLVGYAIVEAGGAALEDLFRLAARSGDSAQLSRLRQVADRAAGQIPTRVSRSPEEWVRSLPELVVDSTLVRGVRWEYFINLATMAPCLNVNRIVFGTDEEYDAFIDAARESLVRWPSEEPLFELARRGWTGTADPGSPGVLERVAAIYMSTGENSCTRTLGHLQAASF